MKNREHQNKHRSVSKKATVILLAVLLLTVCAVGGTVAWLSAQSSTIVNKFNPSTIGVSLTETEATYKMVPGWSISKDPKAKVASGSEDCYLFVKVEKKGGNVTVGSNTYTFDDFIAFSINSSWTPLNATTFPNVYYMVIDEETEKNKDYSILASGTYTDKDQVIYSWNDNEVLTKPEVTEEMMAAVNDDNKPTLSFTAYSVQLWKSNESGGESAKFTPEQAWQKVSSGS